MGGLNYRRNRVERERLEPTLAERLEASAELLSKAKAAPAGTDEATDNAATRKPHLRERMGELRKRLVIKETPRRWWQPRQR